MSLATLMSITLAMTDAALERKCQRCGQPSNHRLCRLCAPHADPRDEPDNGDCSLLEMGWGSDDFDRPRRRW